MPPQRNSLLQPSSLRRSPRFLHLPFSPSTPSQPTSNNPKNGSPFSINGSSNKVNSTNGSSRITRLSGYVDGVEAETRRRSPRFRNESTKGSKNLVVNEFVDFPVTPIRDDEKKIIGGNENVLDDGTKEFSMNFDKRVTRSQSRLMGRNIEVGKAAEGKEIGCDSLKRCTRGVKSRKVLGSVQSLVVRVDRDVGRVRCSEGKENRIDSCEGVVCGLTNVGSDYLSHCGTRGGGRKGRQKNGAGYNGKNCQEIVSNSDRRMTRSDVKSIGEIGAKNEKPKGKRIIEGKGNTIRELATKKMESEECVEHGVDKFRKETCVVLPISHVLGRYEKEEHDSSKDAKLTGVKRKQNQLRLQGTNQGWTKEQEVALHNAYFTAKPSPHFWKKVAKLVPGRSAQECFDKVHSDNQTPVCSKPASRNRTRKSPSDILVSGSILFKSAEKPKSKKTCKTKSKSQVTRKTVRHLLQKYSHVNKNNESDLFSVLEPSAIPSSEVGQVTPKSFLKSLGSSTKSNDRSSSASMKRLSRFSNKGESPLMSPPVLKKVKNMALHEKYIDLLHVRERKRKVAFSRCSKSAQNQKGGEAKSVQMKDMVRAAKNALVSDAKDVIDKFRDSQANIMEAFSDSEEFYGSDYDED